MVVITMIITFRNKHSIRFGNDSVFWSNRIFSEKIILKKIRPGSKLFFPDLSSLSERQSLFTAGERDENPSISVSFCYYNGCYPFFSVPSLPFEIRPSCQKSNEREGDGQHHIQRKEGILFQKVCWWWSRTPWVAWGGVLGKLAKR